MERHVCRIWPLSSPDTVYYMQISWEKDLGSGFTVTLCNGEQAWSGRVSDNEVTMEAKEAEIDRQKYVDELRQALTMGEERMKTYSFDFFKDNDKDVFHFLYEKLMQDISFKLGSVELRKVSDSTEIIKGLIDYVLHCNRELQDKNEHLQQENERLMCDRNYSLKELEKYVKAKEELEQDLYSRFILVLNEKKAKIRSLQEKLKCIDEQVKFSSQSRSVAANSQEASVPEKIFDGSTIEEYEAHTSENRIWSQPSTSANAQSDPISNTLRDVVDIAPSRKRRHRLPQQKNKVEETSQDSQEKRSCPMSSASSAIHHQDEEDESQKTIPNTVEADDLFDNI
ncbi:DNA repair protein XRCC4 [Stegostoma tigrinum]|uniref:DNA repair protein XRCC4 n=1 Tax=Stegostoma tigrinum TaxID=3053191 RepID=UPI0028701DEF|nr:DNA repair protein XRCC4 [Stegostoma tigrinum]XP_048384121.2 DNA repair protein XRCC4 [Stegostoma tigrinum]